MREVISCPPDFDELSRVVADFETPCLTDLSGVALADSEVLAKADMEKSKSLFGRLNNSVNLCEG